MFLRSMLGLRHHKIHLVAAVVIVLAVGIGMCGINRLVTDPNEFLYATLFLLCSILLSFSHIIKERVVRTHPLTKVNFNFKVSVAQLITSIILTPAIMMLSKEYERFTIEELQ